MRPTGANHVLIDGSAQWVREQEMRRLHSWNLSARQACYYQDRKDFPPSLLSQIDAGGMKVPP